MWGRVGRAARRLAGGPVVAAGVVRAYDPMVLGSALAAGLGAAAFTAGGATASDAAGRRVSATAVAVERLTSWAARDRRRWAPLPHTLLVVVTAGGVTVCRWSAVAAPGPPAVWPAGSFTAERTHRRAGGTRVRLVLAGGRLAELSALSGPQHRGGRRALDAVAAVAAVDDIAARTGQPT